MPLVVNGAHLSMLNTHLHWSQCSMLTTLLTFRVARQQTEMAQTAALQPHVVASWKNSLCPTALTMAVATASPARGPTCRRLCNLREQPAPSWPTSSNSMSVLATASSSSSSSSSRDCSAVHTLYRLATDSPKADHLSMRTIFHPLPRAQLQMDR